MSWRKHGPSTVRDRNSINWLIMPPTWKRSWRYFAIVWGVAVIYFVAAQLAISLLDLGPEASPLWPPAGVALGALLLWGERTWPGIALGDFLLMQFFGGSWFIGLGSALGSVFQALVGVRLLRRFGFDPSLKRLQDVLNLVVLAVILSPIVNATLDTTFTVLAGELPWSKFGINWWTLWLGDSMGILGITPPILLAYLAFVHKRWQPKLVLARQQPQKVFEAMTCFGCLLVVSWLVFALDAAFNTAQYPLEYLPFPFVVWAALRFGQGGAIVSSLTVSILAIVGVVQDGGPFFEKTGNLYEAVLLLQTFMAVIIITALVLAATVSERQQAEAELRTTVERDRLLGEIALRIRQSLDLQQTLNTTVAEVRQFLRTDRVLIGYVSNGEGKVVAESVDPQWPSLLGWIAGEPLLRELQSLFSSGEVRLTSDVSQFKSSPHLLEYYRRFQVRASLIVPLIQDGELFALLVAHQCSGPRHWEAFEVDLLKQLATQVMIALQQAHLYQQVQTLNATLEQQVEDRTAQLREKMQELRALYELKDVFLQAVSHDLRTSIMGMLLVLKNLKQQSGGKPALTCPVLERMIQSCDRQLVMINALLEDHFSEGRQIVLHCEPLALGALVSQVLVNLEPRLARHKATVTNLMPDHLPTLDADPEQLQQVFENLILNAIKHNPPGIHLTLQAVVKDNQICCFVEDDGVGISLDQHEGLFKLYVRSLYTKHLTGIGLGLYLCRQIITAHGGEIGFISGPGGGARFWFTLPFAAVSHPGLDERQMTSAT